MLDKIFSDYLVNLRMDKAQQFLKDKELKIIDVANLVGFFLTPDTLVRYLKKHFGQTPVEFRNSINTAE
ncbi:hypothetical protein GCM10020331_102630 [Ectobacillus funiculus]